MHPTLVRIEKGIFSRFPTILIVGINMYEIINLFVETIEISFVDGGTNFLNVNIDIFVFSCGVPFNL
jgi:hypothetical protein